MNELQRILVVDDEEDIRAVVEQALNRLPGFDVQQAGGKQDALAMLDTQVFDLVLTDLAMEHPNSGVELLRAVKDRTPDTIVILLTGYATVESAVAALRLGADDYLIKPSSVADVRASVQAALERRGERIRQRMLLAHIATTLQAMSEAPSEAPPPAHVAAAEERYLAVGLLKLDLHTHQALLGQDEIVLTPTEFAIMRTLAQAGGRVLSFEQIVRAVQGTVDDREEARQLLRSHIRNLRRKLGVAASYLHNVRGIGYYLSAA